jgi:hypothetical protein
LFAKFGILPKKRVNVTHTMDIFGEKVGPKWPDFEKNLFEVTRFRKLFAPCHQKITKFPIFSYFRL